MNFINKLNRKYGRYAISNLMFYIILLYAAGFLINMINPAFYQTYLMLDINKVLHGQIWRIVTFIIQPTSNTNILFLAIELYLYYMIGNALENAWGAFRFNLYYISGILFNILAVIIVYIFTGHSIFLGLTYINRSMFFAFAALYPNVQFLLFFVIPVKVKYLGYIYGVYVLYEVFTAVMVKQYYVGVAILVALGNFLIYFLSTRNYKKISPNEYKRKANYKRQVKSARGSNIVEFNGKKTITRHKCAVCGRTELDDENLEFRFCSKCDGNYEYCTDHLFTHEHVRKTPNDQS
ncbi:rhomboid family intramembrane serine protease [Anaerocolumna sp. MB42-C2]|uniref:rhomboid family intramembrane serine protease n=1 Tax=Anaerocolumna sp. MB42-C2 TaxID=3070997 RepID=UPI0027DFEFB4|nr:rhomboid family intramembrane serine protease [Anaerocolumna sp. MB42-C2]WMJ87905.1 rhomboid family intramembrane serine protease [Anaerocolumna sp. MB42-C2]